MVPFLPSFGSSGGLPAYLSLAQERRQKKTALRDCLRAMDLRHEARSPHPVRGASSVLTCLSLMRE
jgi:hypothetical protein